MDQYRVKPGSNISLTKRNPDGGKDAEIGKKEGKKRTAKLNARLEELQELLYAESKHKILIVLQATDTGGKDGTIRHVFDGVNPQGVKVASFKKPTAEELSHDYLWRIHKHTPAAGELTVFNRSHYEDVLIVRVHNIVPKSVWSKRYQHINNFEKMLADEGTTILKFFLHIDKDEQKERLQSRLDEPEKNWKFEKGDLTERKLWPKYTQAFQEMLRKTSTDWAPWYVIPANRKWLRNLIISQVIVDTLENLDMKFPLPDEGLDKIVID